MSIQITKEKKKRSRGGCLSCKHLRIKCSEDKPTCEYCHYTKRQCVYAIPKQSRDNSRIKKSPNKDRHISVPSPSSSSSTSLSLSSSSSSSSSPFSSPFSQSSSTWNTQLEGNPKHGLIEIDNGPALHEELTRDLVLTQTSSMLGLSRFELRLLKFFDQECISLLSFGVNKGVENAWRYGVPGLFLESELTRSAIFAFSAMTLSLGIDLNLVQGLDVYEDERSLSRVRNINLDDPNNIYTKTTEYFMDTIKKTRYLIAPSVEDHSYPDFQNPKVAKELTTSSVLIFSYLALDPDRLLQVIDFTRESTDLIQVAKGIRHTIVNCAPLILDSEIGGILFFRAIGKIDQPTLKSCEYPVIVALRDELNKLVTDEVSSDSSQEYSILEESINGLIVSIWGCELYKFPVPLFRYLMIISDEFRELLYKKHDFAIRILYIYCALNAVAGFYFYRDRNVWKDYMIWYKNYATCKKSSSWCEIDNQLYELVMDKNFRWEDHTKFHEFDPAVEHNRLYKSECHSEL